MSITRTTMFWTVFYIWSMGYHVGIVPVVMLGIYVYEKRLRAVGPLLMGCFFFFGGYYVTWP